MTSFYFNAFLGRPTSPRGRGGGLGKNPGKTFIKFCFTEAKLDIAAGISVLD
jgi:hypothetical protein